MRETAGEYIYIYKCSVAPIITVWPVQVRAPSPVSESFVMTLLIWIQGGFLAKRHTNSVILGYVFVWTAPSSLCPSEMSRALRVLCIDGQ